MKGCADLLRPFAPTPERPFDLRLAGHLARRVGFGASLAERQTWVRRGVAFALAKVTAADGDDLGAVFPDVLATDDIERARAYRVARALSGARPLAERVTLFWHGHFATSQQKVQSARLMLRQLALFDAQGLGRFDALLLAVSQDPAMLRWLDADRNVKGKPNENFARELFELFALGRGGYSEVDVQQSARAFTGWREQRERFVVQRNEHDGGDKEVLGTTVHTGEDVVALVAGTPRSAEFMATRWLQAFVHPEPTADEVAALARVYETHDRDVGRTLCTLFASELFFAARSYRSKVKAPIDYVVGLVRSAGARAVPSALARATSRLGQVLFEPPSVAGWPRERAWLSSTTWLGRSNFAAALFGGRDGYGLRPDARALLAEAGTDEERAALALDLLLEGDVAAASRRAVVGVAERVGADGAASVLHAVACLPEAHLL
jgi:uncharacterized protein (DUF1800 family)